MNQTEGEVWLSQEEYEEWLEVTRGRWVKPCPACGMPIDQSDYCCDECLSWEEAQNGG